MATRSLFPSLSFNPFKFGDPFGDLERLRHEIDRLVEGAWRPAPEYPALNVWSNEDEAVATAELPGFEPAGIEVSVVQNKVTLRGSRPANGHKEGETYHRRERWSGSFFRTLELPFEVDSNQVEARFENGILSIRLPRVAEQKPKKIEIKRS